MLNQYYGEEEKTGNLEQKDREIYSAVFIEASC